MRSSKSGLSLGLVVFFMVFAVAKVAAAPKSKLIEFWNDSEPTSGLKIDHSDWQSLLEKYVDVNHPSGVNRFNYDGVSSEEISTLEAYISQMQSMDPRQLNAARQKAFWLNLYNASIVLLILTEKPDDSIRDIGRIWRKKRFNISMQEMSFDDIQHGVLRPMFDDPRVHFALCAGTIGSGNLYPRAYDAENIESLIDLATRDFLASKRGVDVVDGELVLSTIFKWYKSDFGNKSAAIKSYVRQYVSPEMARKIDLSDDISYEYDWNLNKP